MHFSFSIVLIHKMTNTYFVLTTHFWVYSLFSLVLQHENDSQYIVHRFSIHDRMEYCLSFL